METKAIEISIRPLVDGTIHYYYDINRIDDLVRALAGGDDVMNRVVLIAAASIIASRKHPHFTLENLTEAVNAYVGTESGEPFRDLCVTELLDEMRRFLK